jgi:hypothetical protein
MRAAGIVTIHEPLYYYRKQRAGGNVSQDSGRSVFDIFKSMAKLEASSKGLGSITAQDISEIKIQRILSLFGQLSHNHKREYFQLMKEEFCRIEPLSNLEILTPKDYRSYKAVTRLPFALVMVRERAKNVLAKALSYSTIRVFYERIRKII